MSRKTKTTLPMPGGSGLGRRLLLTVLAVAALAMVIRDPTGTATAVRQFATWGGATLDGLATFGRAVSP